MPNMGKLISGHNKKLLAKEAPIARNCSCRVPTDCPLQNQCLSSNIIYQASVKRLDNVATETYTGLTSKSFRERWTNHKTSFRLQTHQNESKLSVYIWDIKSQGVDYELS